MKDKGASPKNAKERKQAAQIHWTTEKSTNITGHAKKWTSTVLGKKQNKTKKTLRPSTFI